ncbi:MAG: DUF1588 domain-containing protein [Pirellulaceae bacterium]
MQNTTPDETLMRLASAGKLHSSEQVIQQARRLLEGDAGERFVRDLANQWLDLHLIDFTQPDRKLYPGFDIIVQQAMLDETHWFLEHLLRNDLSVTQLIDADFTFLNSRLARYYDVTGDFDDAIGKASLADDSHRGGLLTHGSIMKVTANGTTTSPVIRGVWVSERLLGQQIPSPPENVPAIEPDVRGATTIRELLAKHNADAACASCHRMIDPPGFALENFDPSGRWRKTYATAKSKKKKALPPIDAGFTMPDGREFSDLESFKELVLADPKSLARNLVEKLVAYGTGATVGYADRRAVDRIVDQAEASDYGFRSLIEATVSSDLFLSK